jgi:NAD+ kinase
VAELLAAGDPTVRRLVSAHDDHEATVDEALAALRALGVEPQVVHGSRAEFDPRAVFVITIGGDGTLLAASHKLGAGAFLLGVNSSPNNSVGFFCAAQKGSVRATLERALGEIESAQDSDARGALAPDNDFGRVVLARMRVEVNGSVVHNRVLNEALFCHASPAATSRYILQVGALHGDVEDEEEQKSSGLWIGPPAGSTAAQRSAGGVILPLEGRAIQYVVREPYTPLGKSLRMPKGVLRADQALMLRNKMGDARLFLDGHFNVVEVTIGDAVRMTLSDEPLTVLGLRGRARTRQ